MLVLAKHDPECPLVCYIGGANAPNKTSEQTETGGNSALTTTSLGTRNLIYDILVGSNNS